MSGYDPLDADSDPFRPPTISTLVGCLRCGEVYDSYRIEWRLMRDADGREHGFWCCPIPGCDGKGFGFDILPTDPSYRDDYGGWITTEDGEEDFDEDEDFDGDEEPHDGHAGPPISDKGRNSRGPSAKGKEEHPP